MLGLMELNDEYDARLRLRTVIFMPCVHLHCNIFTAHASCYCTLALWEAHTQIQKYQDKGILTYFSFSHSSPGISMLICLLAFKITLVHLSETRLFVRTSRKHIGSYLADK